MVNGQELRAILGKGIRFFRQQRQFSQATLAEKAGISITFLSNIERGEKFPKPDIIARLAVALEVEVSDLFKIEHIPENKEAFRYNITEDLTKKMNAAVKEVLGHYLE